jgi:transcriptional regulator with GAF, ATPase, and Fis domain
MSGPSDDKAEVPTEIQPASRHHGRLLAFWPGGFASARLEAEKVVAVGRSAHCELRVDHASVSRRHALIHPGDPLLIEDLDSGNGTRVGGRRIAPHHRVAIGPGTVIELGSALVVAHHLEAGTEPELEGATAPEGDAMAAVQRLAELVAKGTITVLLLGETGVGKEVLAEAIHRASPRAAKTLVRVNCAALAESILEAELFGFERGAFTGAMGAKPGLFEVADGGTMFLDEVGELPLGIQAKLLRVLENREVMRIGSLAPRTVDVRFIAATNRDLSALCAAKQFREDLYFRLDGVAIRIPPLRERMGEIPSLARSFLAAASAKLGRPPPELCPDAVQKLRQHRWPGNIRELRNLMERTALVLPGDAVRAEDLALADGRAWPSDPGSRGAPCPSPPRATAAPARADDTGGEPAPPERERIVSALHACGGNQSRAARMLGMSRRTLVTRLNAYDLPRPRKKRA